jgi:hypothetical protein
MLQKRYKTAAFVVLAQIGFTLLLIPVAWFLAANVENAISPRSVTTLWVAILFISLATFVLRRMLYRWDRLKDIALLKGVDGLLAGLQTNAMILGAMAEIVAILGFLIAVLGGVAYDMFRAAVVALVIFLINFPRRSIWEKIAANLETV